MHRRPGADFRAHAQRLLALVRDDAQDRVVSENREMHRLAGFLHEGAQERPRLHREVHLPAHHRPQLDQGEPEVIFAVAGVLLEDPLLEQRRGEPVNGALREAQPLGEIADADLVLVFRERLDEPQGVRHRRQPGAGFCGIGSSLHRSHADAGRDSRIAAAKLPTATIATPNPIASSAPASSAAARAERSRTTPRTAIPMPRNAIARPITREATRARRSARSTMRATHAPFKPSVAIIPSVNTSPSATENGQPARCTAVREKSAAWLTVSKGSAKAAPIIARSEERRVGKEC